MNCPPVNIAGPERVVRAASGLVGTVTGALLLTSLGAGWVIALEILLVVAGFDLVVVATDVVDA